MAGTTVEGGFGISGMPVQPNGGLGERFDTEEELQRAADRANQDYSLANVDNTMDAPEMGEKQDLEA